MSLIHTHRGSSLPLAFDTFRIDRNSSRRGKVVESFRNGLRWMSCNWISKQMHSGSSAEAITGMSCWLMTWEKFASLLVWALKIRRKAACCSGLLLDLPARILTRMVPKSGKKRSKFHFTSLEAGKTRTTGEISPSSSSVGFSSVGFSSEGSVIGLIEPSWNAIPCPVSKLSKTRPRRFLS